MARTSFSQGMRVLLTVMPVMRPPVVWDGFQLALKAYFAAGLHERLPHAFYDAPQNIGSDVRLCLIGDLIRRTVAEEGLQHLAAVRVVDAGGELAV